MTRLKIWIGGGMNEWRMWGITFKGPSRWWFIGVSRQIKELVQ